MSSMSYNSVVPSSPAPLSPSESNISVEPPPSFTEQEDEFLRELVKRHGTKKWHIISAKMQNKTPRECRKRWRTYLHMCMNKSSWSAEEDRLLLEGHKAYGNRWTEIAKMVPGRTDNAVKNRFNALCKKRSHRSSKPTLANGIESSEEGDLSRESKRSKKHPKTKDRNDTLNNPSVSGSKFGCGRPNLSIEIPGDHDANARQCAGESRKPSTGLNGSDASQLQEVDMDEVMGWLLARTPTSTCGGNSNSTVTSSTSTSPTLPQDISTGAFSQSCCQGTSLLKEPSPDSSPTHLSAQGEEQLPLHGGNSQWSMRDMEELVLMLASDGSMRPGLRDSLH